jgi:hypothetical protein
MANQLKHSENERFAPASYIRCPYLCPRKQNQGINEINISAYCGRQGVAQSKDSERRRHKQSKVYITSRNHYNNV